MSKCKTCKYRTHISSGGVADSNWACFYIVYMGKRRGCLPGDDCTKYEKGSHLSFARKAFITGGML